MKRDRDDILKAAARYFSRGGLRTTSMQEVADAIDVSRSSLYYHWGEKSDLLYELLTQVVEEFIARAKEIVEYPLPASQRLAVLIRTALRLEVENPTNTLALMVRSDFGALKPEQRAAHIARRDEYEGYYRRIIDEGIAAGEFRPVNTKVVTFALLGMLEEFDGWFSPEGSLTSDQVGDVFSDLLLAGLAAERTPGPWTHEPDATPASRKASKPRGSAAKATRAGTGSG